MPTLANDCRGQALMSALRIAERLICPTSTPSTATGNDDRGWQKHLGCCRQFQIRAHGLDVTHHTGRNRAAPFLVVGTIECGAQALPLASASSSPFRERLSTSLRAGTPPAFRPFRWAVSIWLQWPRSFRLPCWPRPGEQGPPRRFPNRSLPMVLALFSRSPPSMFAGLLIDI